MYYKKTSHTNSKCNWPNQNNNCGTNTHLLIYGIQFLIARTIVEAYVYSGYRDGCKNNQCGK